MTSASPGADHDAELLTRAAEEAARLLESDGAMIYLVDPTGSELRFAYDSGIRDPAVHAMLRRLRLPLGQGTFGTALARRELVFTGDYHADRGFSHHTGADEIAAAAGMRSIVAAPMYVNDEPLGVMGTFSSRRDAFNEQQRALLLALAQHAAAAIGNRRLLAELERMLEGRRALDEISRRIVDFEDPADVFQEVVDVASRLLHSDGAHLTLLNDERTDLVPVVMAGKTQPEIRAWLHTQRFPVGGGINGLAAAGGRAVWTEDYANDERIPHNPDDDSARRLELGAAIVAPLLGHGGEVSGTLAITYRQPRPIDPRDVAVLEELSRHASVAARNAALYAELARSELRYRHLVEHSPDLVWEADAEGRLTYLGETLERLTGFTRDELLGKPWTALLTDDSLDTAGAAWAALHERPGSQQRIRVLTLRHEREPMAAEINMVAALDDAAFHGAHGSLRDVTEREQLELDLRTRSAELAATEERARLARELHDSVTQALFSMGLTLRTYELLAERDAVAARAKLAELRQLQSDALAEMRTLIFELRPGGLETVGLEQALRNHSAAVAARTGLEIGVGVRLAERLPPEAEEALYRITQEALHNIVKHANAKVAQVRLTTVGDEVQLVVEDDGVGFDPDAVSSTTLGLAGMRQRAERAGGRLVISRRPGGGTRVMATIGQMT